MNEIIWAEVYEVKEPVKGKAKGYVVLKIKTKHKKGQYPKKGQRVQVIYGKA